MLKQIRKPQMNLFLSQPQDLVKKAKIVLYSKYLFS